MKLKTITTCSCVLACPPRVICRPSQPVLIQLCSSIRPYSTRPRGRRTTGRTATPTSDTADKSLTRPAHGRSDFPSLSACRSSRTRTGHSEIRVWRIAPAPGWVRPPLQNRSFRMRVEG
ncbi:hypothetical protein L227DRAFT_148786 [Lentinus tigrinus ALCF2SS1-6]|uniref:Uncharacterized protein n=1 Tax=Lentinus tigrinus ALCF2SS1-6 TaxID=1328759 RepID=A0A5C2SSZ5_9APHY|nr:hypothetical protein L227DRAFT_148786 [Lentinus tigrinus ALCF2SS1-6]